MNYPIESIKETVSGYNNYSLTQFIYVLPFSLFLECSFS